MRYSPRRPYKPAGLGFAARVQDYTERAKRLGLPENQARELAIRLIKHKMGIE